MTPSPPLPEALARLSANLDSAMEYRELNGIVVSAACEPADLSRALSEIEALRKCVDCIHGDLGLFKMAITMEDPKAELLMRVKMIEEYIDRARLQPKEQSHEG